MGAQTTALVATGVWAGYGGAPVLAGVDLTVRRGEAVALLGRSGVGKSTLVSVLGGRVKPSQGQVTFDGIPVGDTPRRRRKELAARLRVVEQNGLTGIDPYATVEKVVTNAFKEARKAGRTTSNDVEAALAVVDLPIAFVTRKVNQLSGGEWQRVAIAQALATRPDVVLLDEPITALDEGMREELTRDLRRFVTEQGIGMLVASHDLRLVELLADTVHVLADGVLVESGPVREVLRHPQHEETRALVASRTQLRAGLR